MRIGFGLSRELWLIEAGVFLNMLGYGGVLPFEIIYLHNGRGFSLGVAGLVVGTITGIAVVVSPAAGQLIDRFGARLTSIAARVALVARFAEGRRRAPTMALAGALFCGACLLVEVADASRAIAYAVLIVAVIAAGVGECLHTTALTPLVAELAPAHLRGRYMAVAGLCFWIGLAAAPTASGTTPAGRPPRRPGPTGRRG
ncbi:MAG: MFS transporter [Streptosporangiaceae bacterium]